MKTHYPGQPTLTQRALIVLIPISSGLVLFQFLLSSRTPVMARAFELLHLNILSPLLISLSGLLPIFMALRRHRCSGLPFYAPMAGLVGNVALMVCAIGVLCLWGKNWSKGQTVILLPFLLLTPVALALSCAIHGELWRTLFSDQVAERISRKMTTHGEKATSWGSPYRKRILEGLCADQKARFSIHAVQGLHAFQGTPVRLLEFQRTASILAKEMACRWPEILWPSKDQARAMSDLSQEVISVLCWADLRERGPVAHAQGLSAWRQRFIGAAGNSAYQRAMDHLFSMAMEDLRNADSLNLLGASRHLKSLWLEYAEITDAAQADQVGKAWLALSQSWDRQSRFDLWMGFRRKSLQDILIYPDHQDVVGICAVCELATLYDHWQASLPVPWNEGLRGRYEHLQGWVDLLAHRVQ